MNNHITKILKILVIICIATSTVNGQSFDYSLLVQRIQNNTWSNNIGDTTSMNSWVSNQATDGSWSEFEYGSTSTINKHLNRLLNLATVCTNAGHPKYDNEAYKNTIRKGLYFWVNSNTVHSNWWWNKIGWPKELGVISILMREFPNYLSQGVSGVSESQIISLFKPTAITGLTAHGKGANMFDLGLHYIYRGILTEDSLLLVETSQVLEKNLLTKLQADLSFHDHGPQQHIASYGREYQKAVVNIAFYLSGTPASFETNGANFSTFLRFIREVQIPSIRGQYWDYSVTGRSISRKNATKGSLVQLNNLRDFIDTAHASTYDDAIMRMSGEKQASFNSPSFNTNYWKSDYTQHSRPEYLFTIRNVSDRTVECETGNNENLKAHYLSYGANFIAVEGDEYYNIMPVWDWSMIPGVTARQTNRFPTRRAWGVNYGNTSFVGGVSANNYGAVVLEMNHNGTSARKGWFMFDNEIVCLGNSIKSIHPDVRTTINQCHGNDTVYYSDGGAEKIVGNSTAVHSPSSVSWIRQDKIAYFFPNNQNVNFTLSDQSGTWQSINSKQTSELVTNEVFKLWIDHGNSPSEEKYAYIIVPNISDEASAQNHPIEEIEIIANTESTQAVYHRGLNTFQIIFYEADTLTYEDFSVNVDIPCVVQIYNGELISIADPKQVHKKANIHISLNGNAYSKSINLPEGGFAGSTVTEHIGITSFPTNSPANSNIDFNVFPNPGNDYFDIDLKQEYKNINIEVFDVNGKLVFQNNYKDMRLLKADLSSYPSGVYFIYIQTKKGNAIQKWIKQ